MRYIKMLVSCPFIGADYEIFFKTNISDQAIEEYYAEKTRDHNECFGNGYTDWMEENYPDMDSELHEEYWDYWDEYMIDICECGYWEEVDPRDYEFEDIEWSEL